MTLKDLVRFDGWWYAKIPPLLALAYILILMSNLGVASSLEVLGCLLFSVVCVASYGHVINDSCDIEADGRAGKPNAMAALHRGFPILFCGMLVLAGFLPTFLLDYSPAGRLLLFLNYLWPTLYSIPGVRLKERGLWGVLCDAAGSHLTPSLLILTVFTHQSIALAHEPFVFPLAAVAWALAQGIKGILYHQVADRENDRVAGATTFATTAQPGRIERFLPRYNLWIELPASVLMVLCVRSACPLAVASLVGYCGVESTKYLLGFQFALNSNRGNIRPSFPFVNEFFYTVWLPLAAASQLALRDPFWLWLPFLHGLLFSSVILVQWRDLQAVARALGQQGVHRCRHWENRVRNFHRRLLVRQAKPPAVFAAALEPAPMAPERRTQPASTAPIPETYQTGATSISSHVQTIQRAVSFLRTRQTEHGEFPTQRADRADFSGALPDSSIFTTANALCSLEHARPFGVEDLRIRGMHFLLEQMEAGQVWRYWSTHSPRRTHIPIDADDTSCAAFALRSDHPHVFRQLNVPTLLHWRNSDGLFLTWLEDPTRYGWPNDVDSIVNANVLLYFGDCPATRNASAYLCKLIEENREAGSYHYYFGDEALYYALSRAFYHGCHSLRRIARPLADKVLRRIAECGMGNELAASLSLCTLLNLGATETPVLHQLADFLRRRQMCDGSWPTHVYWNGTSIGYYGSAELVTNLCVEALSHYSAAGRRGLFRESGRPAA